MSIFLKCLWYNQRLLIYPHGFKFLMEDFHRHVLTPNVAHEDVELTTKDKVKLRCYLIHNVPEKPLRGTVIIFHGNAMNHGSIVDPHAVTFSKMGFAALTLEYRGYGLSDGTPSESGLCLDAQAGFDFVMNHSRLSKYPIVIFGQSLGGAVAIDVTSHNTNKIAALIIENTFTSVPNLVRRWPMGGFLALFLTQKWYSESKISEMPPSLPILMLSGLRDQVIPCEEVEQLWKAASTRKPRPKTKFFGLLSCSPKQSQEYTPPQKDVFKTFPYGDHNDTFDQRGYWEEVAKFLDDAVPS